jgi:hyperosmotically inducible protein
MFARYKRLLSSAVLPVFLLGLSGISAVEPLYASNPQPKTLTDRVRHELEMLPFYGVFDNLAFSMEGTGTVVLTGQVTRPVLKSDAEAAVRRVEGIEKIVNKIEVLPLSPMDDAIRLATYRAIFSRPGFERYAVQAVSPIRIIVKNGNITLEGVVSSQYDKTLTEMAARSVPLTFGVNNNLTIG